MKGFIYNFIPISSFAWICFGFLFFERIQIMINMRMYIPIFSIVLFLFLKKRNNLSYFLIGVMCYYPFQGIFIPNVGEYSALKLSKGDLETLKSTNRELEIYPEQELKRNFWRIRIKIGHFQTYQVAKWKVSGGQIYTYQCQSRHIKLLSNENTSDYFRFLQPYGNQYLYFYHPKCQKKEFYVDHRRLIRLKIEGILDKAKIQHSARDIAMGLIFGDSGYLNQQLKTSAREGGILHLFAASGLHMGILTGFLFFICSRLPFLNYYTEKILPLVIGFLYLWLLGFPVSLSRAFLFASIFVLSNILFRKIKSSDLLIVTAFFICILDYESYFSVSFLLSFGAVAGILFFQKPIREVFFLDQKSLFFENLSLSISASIGTFLSLVYFFQSFSFGSILINIILVPFTGILLPTLYLSLILDFCNAWIIKDIFWIFSDFLLHLMAYLSEYLGDKIGFFRIFSDTRPGFIGFGIYMFIIINCFLIRNKFVERKIIGFILSFLSIGTTISFLLLGILFLDHSKLRKQRDSFYLVKSDFFLVYTQKILYLGGDCNYKNNLIYNSLGNDTLVDEKVYIENESCIQYALKFQKNRDSIHFVTSSVNPFAKDLNLNIQSERLRVFDFSDLEKILFFSPTKDDLSYLLKNTKSGRGKIVLLLSYKSRDSVKSWNENKKYLGIGKDWTFVSSEDK